MNTSTLAALLRREWLQHRFGWSLLAAIPFGLALPMTLFGHVELDVDPQPMTAALPLVLTSGVVIGATMVMFVIAALTSLIFIAGLARRDHGDRSVEFWLSLPVGHGAALGVPLLTHLLLVPAAALAIGWIGGHVLAAVLVGRMAGFAAWTALPWSTVLIGTLAFVARLMAGLPLAVLWVLPLVLLLVLLNAWFRRWGWVVLVVGLGLLGLINELASGRRWLLETAGEMLHRAALSLIGAGGGSLRIRSGDDAARVLASLPDMAWHDFTAAAAALASPLFVAGLLFAGGCLALLLRWRRMGAGAGD